MNTIKISLVIISIYLLIGTSYADYIIEGGSVCTDNATWGELCTTPHTLHGPGYAYCNATMAEDYGNIDFVWGFNTSSEQPRSIDYYNPRWANLTSSWFFLNVSNIIVSEDACEVGHEYNTYKRNVTYERCLERNETTMECETYEQATQTVCFNSYVQDDNNYTITCHTARMKYWQDISDRMESVNYNWQGMNKWYYIDNISMPAEVTKTIRIWVDMPIVFGACEDTKFFFAAKRTTDTIQEAIAADRFMFLDPWHNASRSHRKTVNVTHVNASGSNLVNYTVFLNVSKETEMQADFDDILFYETDGTAMSFEYENHTTDYGLFWVLVPSLTAASDTQFWMYYGNDAATSSSNPESSWNVNCSMVQHLQEAPANDTAGHLDSTSNDNDGTPKNFDGTSTSTTDGTGIVDGADVFNGTDDYVDLGGGPSWTWTPVDEDRTLSVWFRPTVQPTNNGYPFQFIVASLAPANRFQFFYYHIGGEYYLFCQITNNAWGNLGYFRSTKTLELNVWHHIVFVASSAGNNKIYVNGTSQSVTDSDWNDNTEINPTQVSIRGSAGDTSGTGTVDQVRFYNRVLLANEINQSYQLVENQTTFVAWGSAEAASKVDIWDMCAWNISSQTYVCWSDNPNFVVDPNCGIVVYSNETFTWDGSV